MHLHLNSFLSKFSRYCGNSKALAIIVLLNIAISVILMLYLVMASPRTWNVDWIYNRLCLRPGFANLLHTPWTIISYMFVQLSPLHLIFNLLWLLWFGPVITFISPKPHILRIYILGGLSGALFFLTAPYIIPSANQSPLAGASAAALCIMTLAALRFPDFEMNFFLVGGIRLKWVAPLCILLAFLGNSSNPGGIASHLGGILCGLTYFFVSKTNLSNLIKFNFSKSKSLSNIIISKQKRYINSYSSLDQRHQRLDQLLDKISTSGYDSLSATEKRELDFLSRNS